MPNLLGREPTRLERAEMEAFVIGFPCLIGVHEGMTHGCGGRLIVDRNASPDDWHDCTCPCHRERRRREGEAATVPAILRAPQAPPRFLMPPKKHEKKLW